MLIKTRAIVLKNTNFSETSVISKMYTREHGIRTYMINGVRKAKATISISLIQPLSLLNMEAYEKPGANMQRIKELKNKPLLLNIQSDFRKRSVGFFMVEIMNACIFAEDAEYELFDTLEGLILELEQGQEVSNFPLHFMVKFAEVLGIEPHGDYSDSTPYLDVESGVYVGMVNEHCLEQQVSQVIHQLKIKTVQKHLSLSSTLRKKTLDGLILYFQHHIMKKNKINSLGVLTDLMDAWHKV